MAPTRAKPKRKARKVKLPPYVQQIRPGLFRCHVPDKTAPAGLRWESGFDNADAAYAYASRHRQLAAEVEQRGADRLLQLGDAVQRFLRDRKPAVSPETIRFYRGHLNRAVDHFGEGLPLHRLTRDRLKDWLHRLTKAAKRPGAVHADFRAMRAFVRWALEEEFLDKDPLRGISKILPKDNADERAARQPFLTAERVDELVAEARATTDLSHQRLGADGVIADGEYFAELLSLIFYSGLRRSGVANIAVANVNVTTKPQKRAHGRPLPARTLETIDKGKLVQVHLGDPALRQAISYFLKAAKAAGRDLLVGRTADAITKLFEHWSGILDEPNLRPHALKRAYTDFHENGGMALKDLQAVTRHSTAHMAAHYARADEELVRKAVGTMSSKIKRARKK